MSNNSRTLCKNRMTVGYGQKYSMKTCKHFSDESVFTIKCEIRRTKYTYLCHESPRTIHTIPIRTDRRRDITKLIDAFGDFGNEPKKKEIGCKRK